MKNIKYSCSGLLKPGIQTRNKTSKECDVTCVHSPLSSWKQILEQSQQNDDKTCYKTRDTDSCVV